VTRIAKLNVRFLAEAPLSFAEFRQILMAYGWTLDRIGGSHHIFRHPSIPRPLPITADGKDARRYQMRQARDMIEQFGLRLDDV
jgi:predicted RNA binding protein YcfA (HicA-like mRNA interferase family)